MPPIRGIVIWSSVTVALHFPGGSDGKESACNVGDLGSIPGLGRSLGGGHGNALQYSSLENPWIEQPGGLQSTGCKELDTILLLGSESIKFF